MPETGGEQAHTGTQHGGDQPARHPGRVGRAGAQLGQRAIDVQADAYAREDIANLWRQVHGLRSKLHGELAVLALRIEDNERRAMKRRKVTRRLADGRGGGGVSVAGLQPGLLLVGLTLLAGITLVLLNLHNDADEQEHSDRHHNWFRLTTRDDPCGRSSE